MNDISVYPSTMERVTGVERKRKISEEDTLTQSLDTKRPRISFFIRLESESSVDSHGDDTESVYSIQDKETDVARDSTDTDSETFGSGSELESGAELVTLEYDVASSSDGDDFPDYTSSGTEDLNIQAAAEGAFAAVLLDTSLDTWETDGDTSEGSTIFDAFDFEECRRDFWTCLQCKLHNDNPAYRYCDKCFQKCWQCKTKKTFKGFPLCIGCYKVRKTFFPPRPKPSRKRKHHDESSDRQRVKLDTLQSCLKELKNNANNPTVDLEPGTTANIPNLNFEDIVVPEKVVASTRTYDVSRQCNSDSSDIFDDDEYGVEQPGKKRCKIDSDDGNLQNSTSKTKPSLTSTEGTEGECSGSQHSVTDQSLISSQELTNTQDLESHASQSTYASQTSSCASQTTTYPSQTSTCASQISTSSSLTSCSTSSSVLTATNLKRLEEAMSSDCKPESDSGISSRHTFDGDFIQRAGGNSRDEMCIMCTVAPKNGIFLHGSIGHMCCCYKCAMRVWRNCKRCPVCNCKVKNVVKLFTS